MKTFCYARAALTLAVLSFAALTLAACGADPGQATGGSSGGGDILGMLVSQVLPLVLGSTGVGGALAGGIPLVLNLLRGQKANVAKTEIANQDGLLASIFGALPHAREVVDKTGQSADGLSVLKGLFGARIAELGLTDDALRLLVQPAKPPAPPAG